jgi:uncharacterized protein YwqG
MAREARVFFRCRRHCRSTMNWAATPAPASASAPMLRQLDAFLGTLLAVPVVDQQQALATERLQAADLPADDLVGAASIGARLVADASGASQLGGRPTMPAEWSWPEWNGRPLQHLARIDLQELASARSASSGLKLPGSGQLHLMADALGQGWGFDPAHRGSFFAAIVSSEEAVSEREVPTGIEDEGYRVELEVPVRRVRPVAELVLPDPLDDGLRRLLDDAQFDRYFEVRDQIDSELFDGAARHRLFGRPDLIQNPMELECQLASNGVYVGGPEGYVTPAAKRLAAGARDWGLLAQIDSDEDLGLMWGDLGRIYWWIRHQDAAAGRVDRCWGILQCS